MSLRDLIKLALDEDTGLGDLTSETTIDANLESQAEIVAKEPLVLCGIEAVCLVFETVDPKTVIERVSADGARMTSGTRVALIRGRTRSLLKAERTALNFLQHLSGIATFSQKFSRIAKKHNIRIADTRKTIPGYRALAKYAVRCGGCHNHRASLAEHILIKDNHLAASASISEAVNRAKDSAPHTCKIEVEVTTPDMALEAVEAGADAILLDNMPPSEVEASKELIGNRALIEVSGGVSIKNIEAYAQVGVDIISIGALTHSAPAVDLSMRFLNEKRD